MIRVLIVAEVRLYREGLQQILSRQPDIEVSGVASTGAEALASAHRHGPDVVLLDLSLAEGLAAARVLRRELPGVKVVALAVREAGEDVIAWAEVGMAGYVPRDASIADLVETIGRASRGEIVFPPRIAASLVAHLSAIASSRPEPANHAALTRRERDVVRLIGEGLTNKEIARALSIAVPTVKNHVHNILEKLRIQRRTDAAAFVGAPAMTLAAHGMDLGN
jgi:DNA-binding NarL/FixJ family response regulator